MAVLNHDTGGEYEFSIIVTEEAQASGLFDSVNNEAFDVMVYEFEGLLLVTDADDSAAELRSRMVSHAAKESSGMYEGFRSEIQPTGSTSDRDYELKLPKLKTFSWDDRVGITPHPGIFLIHHPADGSASEAASHVAVARNREL